MKRKSLWSAALVAVGVLVGVAPVGASGFVPVHATGDAPGGGVGVFSAQMRGGTPTTVKEWPFAIAMLRENGVRPRGQSCSASVIAPRKIVIAAHCVAVSSQKTMLYGLDDLAVGEGFASKVIGIKTHPKYGTGASFQGYDVAVLTTESDIPVPAGGYAKVATSQDAGLTASGRKGIHLGYGKKDPDDTQKNVQLHKGEFPIYAVRECSGGLSIDDKTMLCTGYSDGRVTILPGDSGGPLIVDGKIVGLASWSESKWQWYSIFAKLTNEMGDWANQQIGDGRTP